MKTMKKITSVALAMTAGAGVAAAAGADHEIVGKIEHLNPRGHHLTIKAQVYRYDPRLAGQHLRRGEEVRVIYRERHGRRIAYKILPAA